MIISGSANTGLVVASASILGALLLVLGVSGCGASGSEEAGPYAGDIRQAEESATSEFERDVLKDGKITEAEYAEAQARLVSCVGDRGYVVKADESGYDFSFKPRWEGDEEEGNLIQGIVDECRRGTVGVIEGLYFGMKENPEKEDLPPLIAACLVQHGLVPEGFTGDDFVATFADPPYLSKDPNETPDPWVQKCTTNPKGL